MVLIISIQNKNVGANVIIRFTLDKKVLTYGIDLIRFYISSYNECEAIACLGVPFFKTLYVSLTM